jgi:dihydroxyacetone kinase
VIFELGEPQPADQLVSEMVTWIVVDLPMKAGDKVAVLVNGLGAIRLAEL